MHFCTRKKSIEKKKNSQKLLRSEEGQCERAGQVCRVDPHLLNPSKRLKTPLKLWNSALVLSFTHHHKLSSNSRLILSSCEHKQIKTLGKFKASHYQNSMRSLFTSNSHFTAVLSHRHHHLSALAWKKKSWSKITWEISAPRPRLPLSAMRTLSVGLKLTVHSHDKPQAGTSR